MAVLEGFTPFVGGARVGETVLKIDPHYRLEREVARVYCFTGLVKIAYHHGLSHSVAWFNLGNGKVHIP